MPTDKLRLVSLDAFRGLTIAAMIFVNSPGTYRTVYAQLSHAPWNGWTFADTVFPTFLFIVGVSLVFSLDSRKESSGSGRIWLRIVRRTLILLALGLFLNTFPYFYISQVRIPGVLQRIGLAYFFASAIVMTTGIRGRLVSLIVLLASYWVMMLHIPVPEIGAGVLEPGRNFAAYVDSLILEGHMWTHYGTWDPEGLVSTIPAIASTLFGVLTGDWLRSARSPRAKAAGMALAGIVLMISGEVLSQWMPINKNIWTSTFSIFMAGLALTCLSFFHWAIDVAGWKRWANPFVIFGMNAIAMYVLSIMIDLTLMYFQLSRPDGSTVSVRRWIYTTVFVPHADPYAASMLFGAAYVCLMFLLAWAMWKKKWFLKV
ncbi:MAG: heparan-alpha-glucosaminide N-acetyltransferase domain-containing protein [Desulfobacteraceae bacterium]|nr:heparan-alpha-glucosaminide N-acetyltransferase domain-containing protein [Desulfobacteraceae bacterium]